jgi:putative membrane protein
MIWFLSLHIIALLFWCASLLYLPALIAGTHTRQIAIDEPAHRYGSIARFLFTYISTPAALLAIMAGTIVFLLDRTIVTLLAVGHTLAGTLLLHTQTRNQKPVRRWCAILSVALCLIMIAIVWIVLAKPTVKILT